MRLDHLSYAAGPEGLAACVQRLGARLGAAFTDGGMHPSFGTRNFVLGLNNGCYLEVVDVLDHPAVDTAPFGMAVKARRQAGGGWLGWAVRVHDITAIESRLGRRAVDAHHPSGNGSAITLTSLELAGDEAVVDEYLGVSSSQPLDGIDVVWELPYDDDDTGLVAAVFNTPNGAVRLD